jgi:proline iminopeptidase
MIPLSRSFPVVATAAAIFFCVPQLTESQTTVDTGSIPAGKFHLRYRIEGSGIPTLVIGNSIYYPRVFSQHLRSQLRFIFLDHRGFAPRVDNVDTSAYALDTLTDDMERARKTLNLGRIAVIGHSGHAFMALEYAKKYPQNVSHVIMISIGPDMSAATSAATAQRWRDSASSERKAVMAENRQRIPDSLLARLSPSERYIRRNVRDAPRSWYNPRFDPSLIWEGSNVNTDVMNHVWGRLFPRLEITRGLDRLDAPVFLALGRYDFLVPPPSVWDGMRSKFKDITVCVFEKSGHTPPCEEASLFDKELLSWLHQHR